jgi:hypothetical protein
MAPIDRAAEPNGTDEAFAQTLVVAAAKPIGRASLGRRHHKMQQAARQQGARQQGDERLRQLAVGRPGSGTAGGRAVE